MVLLRLPIAVVGEPTVGKSAFVQMVHSNCVNFPKNYLMTMGCDFVVKEFPVNDESSVEVFLFDIAGQKVYETLVPMYLSNISAYLLMYDITDKVTIDGCKKWQDRVRLQNENAMGVLIANKTDLLDKAEVTNGQGETLARNNNMKFYRSSAQRGVGVNEPIEELARLHLEKYENRLRQMQSVKEGQ